jgi:hypothetical protein
VHDRDHAQWIISGVDHLVVDVLLDRGLGHQLGVGEHLPSALKSRAPESVLELEPDETRSIVRVELGEAIAAVQGQETHTAGMHQTSRVRVGLLVGHLHEAVPGDHAGTPSGAPSTLGSPGPGSRVAVEPGPVHLELFISKLNQPERGHSDREIVGRRPVGRRGERHCHEGLHPLPGVETVSFRSFRQVLDGVPQQRNVITDLTKNQVASTTKQPTNCSSLVVVVHVGLSLREGVEADSTTTHLPVVHALPLPDGDAVLPLDLLVLVPLVLQRVLTTSFLHQATSCAVPTER